MTLATKVLRYNQNIEESMFKPMPNVVNKPLSDQQLKQFESFSALGNIPEINLLNELQLGQILKENNIILPIGVRASSPEAMVFIQQKLGELSQGRNKTLSLFDLINIQQQTKEKVEAKLGVIGQRLKTMNEILEQEQKQLPVAGLKGDDGADEEKLSEAKEAQVLITDYSVFKEMKVPELNRYITLRGLGNSTPKLNKEEKIQWIQSKQKERGEQ